MTLIIQEDFLYGSISFYLTQKRDGAIIYYGNKDGLLFEQIVDNTSEMTIEIIPTLKLPQFLGRFFMEQIFDQQVKTGKKTINENLIQGKLIATENHLEDLKSYFEKVLNKIVK